MLVMALLTWISLLFLVLALVGSVAVAATRALRAWRTFKRFSKTTSAAIEGVLETAAEAEQHAVAFTEGTQKLSAALAHLEESRAQLAVIQAAATEARSTLFAFRGAMPRK
jgi:uncharacterized membrane protein